MQEKRPPISYVRLYRPYTDVFGNPRLPNFTWPDVKKFAADDDAPHKITKEMIALAPSKYTILLGGQIFKSLESSELLNDKASFIYSMRDGYKELYQKRLELMQANNLRMEDIHTSGHADNCISIACFLVMLTVLPSC